MQGYFLFLYFYRKRKEADYSDSTLQGARKTQYKFSIIVLSFNEKNLIEKKIENLKALTYPQFEVFFVDASTDNTPQLIEKNISGSSHFHLIRVEKPSRSIQINKALSEVTGVFVLVTDVDAEMEKDALEKIGKEFKNEKIGVVGTYVMPGTDYKIDNLFWRTQNMMRHMESIYMHCPVVSGACYAFRRTLVMSLPEDVWADDIYIPFLVNSKGFYSVYSHNIIVKEKRSPAT